MRRSFERYEIEDTTNFYEEIPSDAEIDALLYDGQDEKLARHNRNLCNRMANSNSFRVGGCEVIDAELFDSFGL